MEHPSYTVCLRMTAPMLGSSSGPFTYSPISCPHPWEAMACHQALNWCHYFGQDRFPTQGFLKRARRKAGRTPVRQGWVCCGGRVHPWERLSLGIILGTLLPKFPEGRTGWGENCTTGVRLAAPSPNKIRGQSFGGGLYCTLIGQACSCTTQLHPAHSFRQKSSLFNQKKKKKNKKKKKRKKGGEEKS